jgi:ABC-2 type transport system permease protein
VLIGFLCKSQGSARALGVVFYLPHLLPSALADFSSSLASFGTFLPSFQFFVPLKAILIADATAGAFASQLGFLLGGGVACCGAALLVLRKRWLM